MERAHGKFNEITLIEIEILFLSLFLRKVKHNKVFGFIFKIIFLSIVNIGRIISLRKYNK